MTESCTAPPPETDELIRQLTTDIRNGLDDEIAKERLIKHGPNSVSIEKKESAWHLLLRQFQSSVVVLLLVASAISFFTQDTLQAVAILLAVVINAVVGFATEWKAQLSLDALKAIAGPTARVVRSGKHKEVSATELVPGDIVVLEAGSRVPADLQLAEAAALSIDESIMTGESMPVAKSASHIEGEDISICIAHHGTHVLAGRGRGIVTATGKNSSLGKLQCSLMDSGHIPTPLEVKLDELGKQLSILTVIVCVLIAGVGLLYKYDIWSMLETGIALAVAAIPEGLPVVATLALAIGTQRMVKAGALIRQLSAVETLGCTTVICSDKTGTLTENKLLVTDIYVDGRHLEVSGSGYEPQGTVTERGIKVRHDDMLQQLLTATSLCNDARLVQNADDGTWRVAGDPTEGALLAAAQKIGLDLKDLRSTNPRIAEEPFDLVRKKMATIHDSKETGKIAYAKGSPERIIQDSKRIQTADGPILFTEKLKADYLERNSRFAENGLRVLGVGMKEVHSGDAHVDEELTFLGLIAMKDTARSGVDQAIKKCKKAGIRVMMLTGDQQKTAATIARELQIIDHEELESVIEGSAIEDMAPDELTRRLEKASVIARVTPDLKLAIVKSLQEKNNVVAMTGDGVNDAPALQQSNIGVAMGLSGTDLAREVSNMVITDDNFSTIVTAIEQGRIIYDNIRRSICYLLTATVASVVTIAVAMLGTGLLALNPLQLLWLNLIMHVFPGLGIVLQGAAPGMMQRAPRDPKEMLLENFERTQIIMRSLVVALAVLGSMEWCKRMSESPATTSTVAFVTISMALLYQAWAWIYVKRKSEAGMRLAAPVNSFMYLMMAISYALIVVAVYFPALQYVLRTVPLDLPHLGVALLASTASLVVCTIIDWALTSRVR